MNERCIVLIGLDDPLAFAIRQVVFEAGLRQQGAKVGDNILKGTACFFGAILIGLAASFISAKTKSDIDLSVLLFAALSKLELAVVTFMSYRSDVKRMKKGVEEVRKHPEGIPICEI